MDILKEADEEAAAVEETETPETVETPETKPEPPKERDWQSEYSNVSIALKQERQARREYEERLGQFETLKEELERHRKEKAASAELEEYQKDPATFLLKKQAELKEQVEQQQQWTAQQQQAVQKHQQFVGHITAAEQAFSAQKPDYADAIKCVAEQRMAEYEVLGVPVEQRQSILQQEAMQLAAQAIQQGRNPAEVAYNYALHRGYKPASKPEEKIVQLQAGQKAAKTLSKGTRSDEESPLKKIESMSDDEFDNYWKENVAQKKRR